MHAKASCPSPNTAASIAMRSPTTRLTANCPQSSSGITRSMTARTRPSRVPRRPTLRASDLGALAFILEVHHCEGRQRYADGVIAPVRRYRMGSHSAQVAHAAAPVARCVGVEDLTQEARKRHADDVVFTGHGRKVADDEHHVLPVARLAHESERAEL